MTTGSFRDLFLLDSHDLLQAVIPGPFLDKLETAQEWRTWVTPQLPLRIARLTAQVTAISEAETMFGSWPMP